MINQGRAAIEEAAAWWSGLGPDVHLWAWWSAGLALLGVAAWCGVRVYYRLGGFRCFRGTWYSLEQYEALLWQIDQDQRSGHRVMRADEMAHLRRWKYGGSGAALFSFKRDTYT